MRKSLFLGLFMLLAVGVATHFLIGKKANREKREKPLARRAEESPQQTLKTICKAKNIPLPLPHPKIVVKKTAYSLSLYNADVFLKKYPIALGFNSKDDKETEGDGCTPEGKFYICGKNPQSKFHLSLALSYPNMEDARRGLQQRLINRNEHEQIISAIRRKRQPPWNTQLGGEVYIHGGGIETNWTLGCIAMKNKHIEEIFEVVKVGTPVTILH